MDVEEEAILAENDSVFEALVDLDDTVRSDVLCEDSFSSVPGVSNTERPPPIAISTPARSSAPVRLRCTQCGNTYANQRTLDTHQRMHAMKSASSRLPNITVLEENGFDLGVKVVQELMKETLPNEDSQKLLALCDKLVESGEESEFKELIHYLNEHFFKIVRSRNVLLLSALRCALYIEANKLFSQVTFRRTLKDYLKKVANCEEHILNLFIGSFVLKFFDKVLAFAFKVMHGQNVEEVRCQRSADLLQSVNFQQTLYHIVGSVLHACFVRGRMYKDSTNWGVYCSVLKAKCIREPELGNQCQELVTAFSSAKDRGGYAHCNQETFDFFYKLFELLLSLEGENGSLPLELVDQEISQNDILLFLWDDLIGSELTEEQSMFLLLMITHICVKITVKGVIKRRLNEELKASFCSVALRPRLAKK